MSHSLKNKTKTEHWLTGYCIIEQISQRTISQFTDFDFFSLTKCSSSVEAYTLFAKKSCGSILHRSNFLMLIKDPLLQHGRGGGSNYATSALHIFALKSCTCECSDVLHKQTFSNYRYRTTVKSSSPPPHPQTLMWHCFFRTEIKCSMYSKILNC